MRGRSGDSARVQGSARPPIKVGRLVVGLALVLGSVSSVTLLLMEGYSARAMVVIGLTLILTSIVGLWFTIRGTWD